MSTMPTPNAATQPQKLTVKVRAFSLKTFEPITKDETIDFYPTLTFEEALEESGPEKLLELYNLGKQKLAKSEAKSELTAGEETVPLKIKAQFVNITRITSKRFSAIGDRKAQTEAIMAALKSDEKMQSKFSAFAAAFADDDDFEEDDDEAEG